MSTATNWQPRNKIKIKIPIQVIPLLEASQIKMDMQNVTLTHHLASQIRNRNSEVGIKKRLSEKYKWNYQLQQEVDMEIFKQNFTSFTNIIKNIFR